ncbi:MAG: hypothetical protein HVK36_02670, partial [Pelagibacteraceae bacterium]|nr:hypothetical protein [Pelagibacteraceae bacterium]
MKNLLIDPTFPDKQGESFGIDTLSQQAADLFRERYPDAMDPGLRNRLIEYLEYVLNYGKDVLRESGNTSDTWTTAWWRWAGMFLESLEHLLRELGGGQLTRAQFFGAASFPVPDQERWSYSERLNAKEFKRIVEERFKNQEAVDAMLESGIYPDHVGISSLPWGNFWEALVKERHPVTTLFFLNQEDDPEERINSWANTTEQEFVGP